MKHPIVILGASEYQNALIQKAKDMGFETHVFAWQTGDIGEETADFFYPISIIDQKEIAAVCQRIRPEGFASAASNGASCIAAALARCFGKPANGKITERLTINKAAMRDALMCAGLPQPRFFSVSAAVPLEELRNLAYPLLVKPSDRSNARGMSLARTDAELMRAVSGARDRSFIRNAIVEEFIRGDEYACEAISYAGKHHILCYTSIKTTGAPLFQISEASQPVLFEDTLRVRLDAMVLTVLDAFEIAYGASHIRFILDPSGAAVVLDVRASTASDHIGSNLVEASTGYDLMRMVIDVACGKAPDLSRKGKGKPSTLRLILPADGQKELYNCTPTALRKASSFMEERRSLAERIKDAPLLHTHLFFMGHAGFVLKSKIGTMLAVDLYLSDCVERMDGFKRLQPKLFFPDELAFDYVLATHHHYDHFDIDAIPHMLAHEKTRLLAAKDCRAEAEKLSLDKGKITYIAKGGVFDAGDIRITCVYCDHGKSAPDAVGLVIAVDEKRLYIAGDTALRLDLAAQIREVGPFDVMIAPINGAFGNLNEAEAATLAAFIQPELTIPCHYWDFAEQHGDPGVFADEMSKQAPGQPYLLMAQGECLTLTNI